MSKPLTKCFLVPKRHLLENGVVCSSIWGANFKWWRQEEECKWTEIREEEEAGLLLANSRHSNSCAQANPEWAQEDGGKVGSITALGFEAWYKR